ncbi:MAG: M20/M25/M40 family metallo-hydrolase [Candidatus Aureabacteria bacterium]|nr:M20/M25/M40 family metallo-hydrolase [Candidatus Auribacterota bacterium]
MFQLLYKKSQWICDRALSFTQKLVQTPSQSLIEEEVARLVENEMKKIGFEKIVPDDAGNVTGIILGRKMSPTVLLNCHMDTAHVLDEDKWSDAPYSGTIKDGRLFGLGASDCKAGLAAQLFAAEILKNSLLPFDGNLIFSATVCEEDGGSIGVKKLMDETLPMFHLKPDIAILGEPTSLGVYYGHDGWMEAEIRVEGGNPFQVQDAANEIFSDFDRNYNNNTDKMHIFPPRFDNNKGMTCAVIDIARRFGESEEPGTILNNLKHEAMLIAEGTGCVAVETCLKTEKKSCYTGKATVIKHIVNAWTTDPFNAYLSRACQALKAGGEEVMTGKWKLGRLGMGTAGAVFLNDYQIPVIGYGPGSEDAAHAVNEYVEIKNIERAIYGTAVMVHGIIGTPVFGWTMDEI